MDGSPRAGGGLQRGPPGPPPAELPYERSWKALFRPGVPRPSTRRRRIRATRPPRDRECAVVECGGDSREFGPGEGGRRPGTALPDRIPRHVEHAVDGGRPSAALTWTHSGGVQPAERGDVGPLQLDERGSVPAANRGDRGGVVVEAESRKYASFSGTVTMWSSSSSVTLAAQTLSLGGHPR